MWPILGCSLFLLLPDHSISAAVPRPNGRTFPATDAFDRVVTDFMLANGIVGASVAVTVRGKVAYEQGYGAANVMAGSLVQPSSVFRIASLTKMHTSAAILLLEQQGKLRLSDTVFGPPPSLLSNLTGTPPSYPGANVDPRLRKITLRHLLHHIGGWCARGRGDAAVCNAPDPMFEPKTIAAALGVQSPPGPNDIVRYMASQPLQYDPGTAYAYSNFGCVALSSASRPYDNTSARDIVGYNHARMPSDNGCLSGATTLVQLLCAWPCH
jgi:CubicO group peptidase (beta-lactamase class C family)